MCFVQKALTLACFLKDEPKVSCFESLAKIQLFELGLGEGLSGQRWPELPLTSVTKTLTTTR